jgi:hypothetical protein
MLAFMAIDPDLLGPELGLYVMVRSEKFFDQCILDYKTVATRDDLRSITMDYPFPDHTLLPGPLFRALIVFVEETNSAAIITNSEISPHTTPGQRSSSELTMSSLAYCPRCHLPPTLQ